MTLLVTGGMAVALLAPRDATPPVDPETDAVIPTKPVPVPALTAAVYPLLAAVYRGPPACDWKPGRVCTCGDTGCHGMEDLEPLPVTPASSSPPVDSFATLVPATVPL